MTDENILIKLKRKYSKDELVSSLRVKIGQLESYIDELQDIGLIDLKKKYESYLNSNELYNKQRLIINKLEAENKRLRNANTELLKKIL